ncbi:MAG TPA: YihY/virulence factor BrkB family protein [Aggregatilineales bacterium]|nr:YihY/virulence factor BrkB family protein [Aggregatilineales bacterium]
MSDQHADVTLEERSALRLVYERYRAIVVRPLLDGWQWINRHTNNYVLYITQAVRNYVTKGQNEAVGFAYWAIFSLFPFLVLLIIIAASMLGARYTRVEIFSILSQLIPEGGSTLIKDTLEKIIPRQHTFSLISAVGLVIGAIKLFINLQGSLSRIFRDEQRRKWYLQPLVGLTMMITFGFLITLSIGLVALFRAIDLQVGGRRSFLAGSEPTIALFVITTLLFALLFRYIPQRKVGWRVILPVSALGAGAWVLGRSVFNWYLANVANLGAVYGSLAAIMGLLMWMFFLGSLISLCGEMTIATADWQAHRPPAVAIAVPEVNYAVDELTPTLRREFAVVEPGQEDEIAQG